MVVKKTTPDEILEHLGGCGKFQWRLTVLVHGMKALVCWSMMSMVLMAAKPPYVCGDDDDFQKNESFVHVNVSTGSENVCVNLNGSSCSNFKFVGEMKTIVSEVGTFYKEIAYS